MMIDVESKRSSGLTAVWLARNRFAVLDKAHQVSKIQCHIVKELCLSVHHMQHVYSVT